MAMNLEDNGQLVVPKKKVKSEAWLYFGFRSDDVNQEHPVCRFCRQLINTKGGNTTNLMHHIRKKHPFEYSETKYTPSSSQTTGAGLSSSINSSATKQDNLLDTQQYSKESKRWNTLTSSVTRFIVKGLQPFHVVDRPEFVNLLKVLDPHYTLPDRKYFSQTAVPEMYNTVRDDILKEMSNDVHYFAGTTDLWSSCNSQPLMSFTLHFVNQQWSLESRHLQTIFYPDDHTWDHIASGLKETFQNWRLDEKYLVCLTTDNASNMIKACELNSWPRLQCFGQRLHLAVNNALRDSRIERAVSVCKNLVSSFSNSWRKKRELLKAQVEMGLPMHSLITISDTRWGSMYYMIARFLEQEKAVNRVFSTVDCKSSSLLPKRQDIEVLECIHKALSPVVEFTDALGGEDYVSVSSVIPVLHMLNNTLSVQEDDLELTNDIKLKILNYLNQKYEEESSRKILNISTFLDPRYKSKFLNPVEIGIVREEIAKEVQIAYERNNYLDFTLNLAHCQEMSGPSPAKKSKLSSLLKKHSVDMSPRETDLSIGEMTMKEMDQYVSMQSVDMECSPLSWWRDNCANFPKLSKLVKKYLCIPATSCSSERLFSTSGNITTSKRNKLNPDKLNMLVFLAKNAK